MGDNSVDLFFLNPSDNFYKKLNGYLIEQGFEIEEEKENNIRYSKSTFIVDVCLAEDWVGKYIIVTSLGIDSKRIREILSICPECGSNRIMPSLFMPWRNAMTEELYDEGKLDYGPGAYDRIGTRPPTKKCIDCGCRWHNMADIKFWSNIVKEGREITKEDLGIV